MLRAAERLFKEKGYSATTIDEVAARAGVSPATVFNYYGTKSDLLLALIAEENAAIIQRLRELTRRGRRSTAGVVCSYLEAITTESLARTDRGAWRQVLATIVTNAHSDLSQKYIELRQQLVREVVRLVKNLQTEGALPRHCRPEILGKVFYQVHYALFLQLVADEGVTIKTYQSRLREEIGHLVDLICGVGITPDTDARGSGAGNTKAAVAKLNRSRKPLDSGTGSR